MRRRQAIKQISAGALTLSTGCLGNSANRSTAGEIGDIQINYPGFSQSFYYVYSRLNQDKDGTPIQFEDLSSKGKFEFANSVHRSSFVTGKTPELLQNNIHHELVEYRNEVFTVGASISEKFYEPEYGPDSNSKWQDPLAIEPEISNGKFHIKVTNNLGSSLDFHHIGRPYFGILTAIGETVTVFDHDQYQENKHVLTEGAIRTEDVEHEQKNTITLPSGDSLSESYEISGSLSNNEIIWFPIWVGNDSTEIFGNNRTVVDARFVIKS